MEDKLHAHAGAFEHTIIDYSWKSTSFVELKTLNPRQCKHIRLHPNLPIYMQLASNGKVYTQNK